MVVVDFLSSTVFGALNNKKAICLGYAAAYAYLVQNMHPEIYKHADGTWKTKEEVGDDYIIDYSEVHEWKSSLYECC